MKKLLWSLPFLFLISFSEARPRHPFPETVDQVWQNDEDLFNDIAESARGTTSGENADVGFVGEYISSTTAVSTFTTSGQYGDGARVTLTPGDWDVTLVVNAESDGATWSSVLVGISSITGNSTITLQNALNATSNSWASSSTTPLFLTISIPNYRVSTTTTETYYAKLRAGYTVGTPRHYVRLSARRAPTRKK